MITNPTLAINSVIDYVNEWRDALQASTPLPASRRVHVGAQ